MNIASDNSMAFNAQILQSAPPAAHPLFILIVGSTMAEIPLRLQGQPDTGQGAVPLRCVVVDALPYADAVERLVQAGWTRDQVTDAMPRSHYFHLESPFSDSFRFDDPLNSDWRTTIFEPSLERLAARPDSPGCAGTPALGRARVEGQERELRNFLEQHLHELIRIRPDTLALLPGVVVYLVTTYRGGTGTGASALLAALLRTVMPDAQIHAHVVMPCVYGGDDRAYANAYAALRESQACHRFNEGVPVRGGRLLKPPFDSFTPVFARNSTVALGPQDALTQVVGILRAYRQARTQQAINARHVDLTDVIPYDLLDLPTHVRTEIALSVRTVQPGVLDYLAMTWIRQEIEALHGRFEAWTEKGMLTPEEDQLAARAAEDTIRDLGLQRDALLARIDPSPQPANALRTLFEQISARIGSMRAADIKQSIPGLPVRVRDTFLKFERSWADLARQLTASLPRQVTDHVLTTVGSSHLALAVMRRIIQHLSALVGEARQEAEREKTRRDTAGAQLGPALHAVQQARGILVVFNSDEVTRDAAHKACGIAMSGAMARVQQQRLEYLVAALEGGMTSTDGRGRPVKLPSILEALGTAEVERLADMRKRLTEQLERLQALLADLGQAINRRSRVFQRSVLLDDMSTSALELEAQGLRKRIPHVPAIARFLEGSEALSATVTDVVPLIPSYTACAQPIARLLTEDPVKREIVVHLLRGASPFTPLDPVIEEQQGLRNRRDSLVILELPGGQDGALADLMLREGIVASRNHIVDSGDDEIRIFKLRDGLPYYAIRALSRYEERHAHYLSGAGAVTPYTTAGAHRLPRIAPPRTNLRRHTEQLVYTARAALAHRLAARPSGGFDFIYEEETGQGFAVEKQEHFDDLDSLVGWLAKRIQTRKALERELARHLDEDPEAYRSALLRAWHDAEGIERERLREALYELKVDPSRSNPGIGPQSRTIAVQGRSS